MAGGRFECEADMAGPAAGSTRSLVTHNVTSPLSIDALRKLYSITCSVMARRPGRSIKARQKAAFNLAAGRINSVRYRSRSAQ
jgi:hypothetical protein